MDSEIGLRLMLFIPVILSLAVHEWAHARAAWALGDDTAAHLGRLTLNPLAHLDPVGTLLPLLGVPFGWAKPVPINPNRFHRGVSLGFGLTLTAAAGPISNFVLAALCLGGIGLLRRTAPELLSTNPAVMVLLTQGVLVNIALGVFNFLPIPPLDGSRIVDGLMPFEWRSHWERVARYGWLLLLFVIIGLPLLGLSIGDFTTDVGLLLIGLVA